MFSELLQVADMRDNPKSGRDRVWLLKVSAGPQGAPDIREQFTSDERIGIRPLLTTKPRTMRRIAGLAVTKGSR